MIHVFQEERSFSKHATRTKPIQYEVTTSGCWSCISHKKDKDGYVRLRRSKKDVYLHRLVYEQEVGKIPEGLVILHSCDNPSCINPDHLSVGTIAENQLDKVKKNRQAKGSQNGNSKLTEEQVLEIRADNRPVKEIAEDYKVSTVTIYGIKNKQYWRNVQ